MNKYRYYVLDNSLNWSGVHFLSVKWFKQTLWFCYFTEMILGSFGNGPMNKIRHHVLGILLLLFNNHSIPKLWMQVDTMFNWFTDLISGTFDFYPVFKHKLCVRYCTELVRGWFGNRTVNKIKNNMLNTLLVWLIDHSVYNE